MSKRILGASVVTIDLISQAWEYYYSPSTVFTLSGDVGDPEEEELIISSYQDMYGNDIEEIMRRYSSIYRNNKDFSDLFSGIEDQINVIKDQY